MRVKFYSLFAVTLIFAINITLGQSNQHRFSQLDVSNGLSHNQVNCMLKDPEGFMWFGTASGLNRFDGYTFKVFRHDANNKNSLPDDFVAKILEGPDKKLWISTRNANCFYDPETEQFNSDMSLLLRPLKLPLYKSVTKIVRTGAADFWFLYPDSGIYRYSTSSKQTIHYNPGSSSIPSLHPGSVADITADAKGDLWIVYSDGTVEKFDVKINKITYHTDIFKKAFNKTNGNYSLTVDRDNDLWFFGLYVESGVFYYKPSTGTFLHIDKESPGPKLKANLVSNVIQADDGHIWIATDHGGISVLDKKKFDITTLLNREDDPRSLRQNSVSLYKDNTGIMWAGTFKKGISYYHKNIIKFPLYRHLASDPASLPFNDVDKFTEDKLGNLWIGTNGGGLIYFNRKTGKYTQYKHDPGNPNSLSNDIIINLYVDHDQNLWIGTYFGGLDRFDGKTFTHYKHDDRSANSIADDRVWSILEDSSNRLWIGTFDAGLEIFDRSKGIFYHPYKQSDIRSRLVTSIFEDKQGNIWIGGYLGIDVILKNNGRVIHYITAENGLIDNTINSINQDSRGLMWIATPSGLSILDPKTNTFTSFTKKNGLPANSISNTEEDSKGAMWLSTSNGLSRVTLTPAGNAFNFHFENFDEMDGLQGREFNVNSALKTRSGELIFGGGDGFNMFDPASIEPVTNKPKLVFTDLQLFNKSISANEVINGDVVLSKAIGATRSITLDHSENVFSIEFAALDFLNPSKIKHQYMLEGFDKGWVNADNRTRKASYTNLDQGDYVFKVRASNSEGVWNSDHISLKIKVLPPFWESTFAYILYAALSLGILLFIRQRGIQKIRREFVVEKEKREAKLMIEQERQEVRRMQELDQLKTKFLTNVSHEFRTPLSLIMAPVDKMQTRADAEQKQQLNMIKKNARRLLHLVNQLLDFRKMEVQELKLHSKPGDIVKFISEISLSFTDIAEEKKVGFVFDTTVDSIFTSFDHDKIERILFNLISNAFKFTPAGSQVSVMVNVEKGAGSEASLEIKVIDTGIGIPHEKHSKIFERFFQNDVPESMINQGSGIGLAITREFVKMHGGEITVESEPDHGSCFIIKLPIVIYTGPEMDLSPDDDADNERPDDISHDEIKTIPKQHANKKPVVLLVEDNDDFRFYLKDNLKDVFFLIEASNGREGWQKALSQHPDIIVSDISMPEMTGIELCKKLKNDKRTSHIPLVLLTALTGEAEQVKGLEIGANDYMTKPFNFEILLSKIKNILTLRDTYKRTYKKQMDVQLQETPLQNEDEKLLRSIVEYIEHNILNDSLSVEELSRNMNMSRGSLYNKVLALTGRSPVEFIRSIRLKKAVYLLENSQMTISQICYEVGFNTPKYFTKLFKEEYDMLPSAYINSIRQKKLSETED